MVGTCSFAGEGELGTHEIYHPPGFGTDTPSHHCTLLLPRPFSFLMPMAPPQPPTQLYHPETIFRHSHSHNGVDNGRSPIHVDGFQSGPLNCLLYHFCSSLVGSRAPRPRYERTEGRVRPSRCAGCAMRRSIAGDIDSSNCHHGEGRRGSSCFDVAEDAYTLMVMSSAMD
jgi:hypothetical protein